MNATPLPLDDYGDDTMVFERFLPGFLPWEVQEIACIDEYLTTRWATLLREASVIASEEPQKGEDPADDCSWDELFAHIRSRPASWKGTDLIPREM